MWSQNEAVNPRVIWFAKMVMVTSAVNSMVIVTLKFKTWRRSQPAARKHGNGNGNGHIVDAHGDGNFSNKIQTESRGALRVVTHCGLNKGNMNSLIFVHGLLPAASI